MPETLKCCYCETLLTKETKTKEHVVPKRFGGIIIMPCCLKCNSEKGWRTLSQYTKFLKERFLIEKSMVTRAIITVKLKNALMIKKDIKHKQKTKSKPTGNGSG